MTNIHDHIIKDGDSHFVIDPATRGITNTTSNKTSLMQYDHNSERFSFEISRFVEGHDMSISDSVHIHYLNTGDDRTTKYAGVYEVSKDDITVVAGDNEDGSEDKLVFTWLISNLATQYSGMLSFAVTFVCGGQNGELPTYRWSTAIHNAIVINPSMNNGEVVVSQYADILQDWYDQLFDTRVPNIDENSDRPVRFYVLTQAEYDALEVEDALEPDVVYAIKDAQYAEVDDIIDGTTAAGKAKNYDENEGTIKDKFEEIDSKLQNVDTAKNYDENEGNINDKFDEIDGKLGDVENEVEKIKDGTTVVEHSKYSEHTTEATYAWHAGPDTTKGTIEERLTEIDGKIGNNAKRLVPTFITDDIQVYAKDELFNKRQFHCVLPIFTGEDTKNVPTDGCYYSVGFIYVRHSQMWIELYENGTNNVYRCNWTPNDNNASFDDNTDLTTIKGTWSAWECVENEVEKIKDGTTVVQKSKSSDYALEATYAYYAGPAVSAGTIDDRLDNLNNNIVWIVNGTTVAGKAKNYDENEGNINDKFTEIDGKIANLGFNKDFIDVSPESCHLPESGTYQILYYTNDEDTSAMTKVDFGFVHYDTTTGGDYTFSSCAIMSTTSNTGLETIYYSLMISRNGDVGIYRRTNASDDAGWTRITDGSGLSYNRRIRYRKLF